MSGDQLKELENDVESLLDYGGPEAAAAALFRRTDIDKAALGEYLGRNKEENKKVLEAFVSLFDFSQLELDDALRVFLGRFRLPGEAQVIDRFMSAFAQHYHAGGVGGAQFATADTAYVLAFSVIMLNTDLHSPRIAAKSKMTKAEFVRNNRGVDGGADVPQELLEAIYDRIAAEEIALDVDTGTRSGWLTKQGAMVKSWKKRWFVLRGQELSYYRAQQHGAPRDVPIGVVALRNLSVGRCSHSPLTLVLRPLPVPGPSGDIVLGIENRKPSGERGQWRKELRKTFMLTAESEDDMADWAAALADALQPSFTLLSTLQDAVTQADALPSPPSQRSTPVIGVL
eukprot:m51a1_g8410 putative ankyrin repeat-containing protein (342) ;mRNA; f:269878-276041